MCNHFSICKWSKSTYCTPLIFTMLYASYSLVKLGGGAEKITFSNGRRFLFYIIGVTKISTTITCLILNQKLEPNPYCPSTWCVLLTYT